VRRVTADTALRLGRYFGSTAQFWFLQRQYDIAMVEGERGAKIVRAREVRRRSLNGTVRRAPTVWRARLRGKGAPVINRV
jgi:plasmid maintenance system antidote protein VapI